MPAPSPRLLRIDDEQRARRAIDPMKVLPHLSRWTLLLALIALAPMPAFSQEGQIRIDLYSPNEGETFYAGPTTVVYSMQISGYVEGVENPESVVVALYVIQDSQVIGTEQTELDYDSHFQFDATVNPGAWDGSFTPVDVEAGCETCHHTSAMNLPAGPLTLQVVANAGDGRVAQAERHVMIDRSEYIVVPVEVVTSGDTSRRLPGVEVEASTWLYLWRARHTASTSDESGTARMRLEALSAAPTHYTLEIKPSRIDGILYQGLETIELTLQPGEENPGPIQIQARAQSRVLSGRVFGIDGVSGANVDIWAVRLSDRQSFQTTTGDQGEFSFADLPIDRYYVGIDPYELAQKGWQSASQVVDLFSEGNRSTLLMAQKSPAVFIEGTVLDELGKPLPFAQVAFVGNWKSLRVLPSTKTWIFDSVTPRTMTLTASAPGYLSRDFELEDVDSISGIVELPLAPNPETQVVPMGDGEVTIPVETDAEVSEDLINMASGWLWGRESSGQIITHSIEISLENASFALEDRPEVVSRLYLYAGSARVSRKGQTEQVQVPEGTMIDFSGGMELTPVRMEAIIDQIDAADPRLSFPEVWKQDETKSASETVGRAAIGAAQLITLITYYSVLLLLIASPFAALYFWRKRSK